MLAYIKIYQFVFQDTYFKYVLFISYAGSHDLLYQEFLPLLPNLLQG